MKKLIRDIEKIVNPQDTRDPGECAAGFRIGVNVPENKMRITLCRADGSAIGHMEFFAADAYSFTEHVLRGYDRLEGIR